MRYYMFNKPRGYITACSDERHKTVMDLIPEEERAGLFPVGRLDRDTEGLLLVTDDGALCARLLSPENGIEKTYLFYALGTLSEEKIHEIEQGIKLYPTRDERSAPAAVSLGETTTLGSIKHLLSPQDLKRANRRPDTPVISGTVTVTEGKRHEVKRLLLFGDCRIVYLKRLSMGTLTLDEALPRGTYRPLSDSELKEIKSL